MAVLQGCEPNPLHNPLSGKGPIYLPVSIFYILQKSITCTKDAVWKKHNTWCLISRWVILNIRDSFWTYAREVLQALVNNVLRYFVNIFVFVSKIPTWTPDACSHRVLQCHLFRLHNHHLSTQATCFGPSDSPACPPVRHFILDLWTTLLLGSLPRICLSASDSIVYRVSMEMEMNEKSLLRRWKEYLCGSRESI